MKYYVDGILTREHDDATRTVTTYDETGTVTSTRPYTADENAAADAAVSDAARLDSIDGSARPHRGALVAARRPGRRSTR